MNHIRKLFVIGFALAGIVIAPTLMASDFKASVAWASKVALSVPVSGRVASVSVMPGQAVNQNQQLLQLDQSPFVTALKRAKAALKRQRIVLKAAKRDRDQARELYDRGVSSTVEFEEAKETYQRAVADLQIAETAVLNAQYGLDQSTLKAPFDGWVISRHVEPGQTIVNTSSSTTLIVMVTRGEYVARALLDTSQLTGVEMGKSVDVEVRDKRIAGKIVALGLEPEHRKDKKKYKVEVRFTTDMLIRAGETVEVEVK